MHKLGHHGISAIATSPIVLWLIYTNNNLLALFAILTTLFTANIPDWDLKIPLMTHRGVSHTIWVPFIIGGMITGISYSVNGTIGIFTTVIMLTTFVSITSHIVSDTLTPSGAKLFYPIKDKVYTYNMVYSANSIVNGSLGVVSLLIYMLYFQAIIS